MHLMLTGEELKAKLAAMGQVPEGVAAIECGYVTKAGKAALAAFRQAQLQAHGLAITAPKTSGRKGKPLSFVVTTSAKGNVVLAGGYTALIGIEPGEQVAITHQGNQLILTKVGAVATALQGPISAPSAPVVTYDSAPALVAA